MPAQIENGSVENATIMETAFVPYPQLVHAFNRMTDETYRSDMGKAFCKVIVFRSFGPDTLPTIQS